MSEDEFCLRAGTGSNWKQAGEVVLNKVYEEGDEVSVGGVDVVGLEFPQPGVESGAVEMLCSWDGIRGRNVVAEDAPDG